METEINNINKKQTKKGNKSRFLLLIYDGIVFILSILSVLISYHLFVHNITWVTLISHIIAPLIGLIVFRFIFKVSKQIWRYGGIECYIRLIIADGFALLSYLVLINSFEGILRLTKHSDIFVRIGTVYSISIMGLNLLVTLSIRMLYRYAYKYGNRKDFIGKLLRFSLKTIGAGRVSIDMDNETQKIRVAIIGAGTTGVILAEELFANPLANYIPVCFIDKNKEKTGNTIRDLPVIEENNNTIKELQDRNVQEVIVAIPQLNYEEKREIFEKYKKVGFKVKVYDYPMMNNADGKRSLREFDVEELLFRQQIQVNNEKTSNFYKDKVVLVTGAGGSIGSVLARQIAHMSPKKLILLDVYENSIYDVEQHLKRRHGNNLDFAVEVISITDKPALERVFEKYKPNIVLHAAAHKHVPLMEHNCIEAVSNNVFGTLNVVLTSEKYGVERMMMVSTDKAVNPTNVMGATKRMCELIVQCHSAISTTTTFSATRFGNVLGSNGSVIPLFKRQIANGGPVTITDKRIIRYFMTIPEATQLILESASKAHNGELFVLDMGKPVKILDLAENMITLSGYIPYKDIDIVEVGLRPGEKLYEELLVKDEKLSKTDNELIFIEKDTPLEEKELNRRLDLLKEAIKVGDDDNMREVLKQCVPTFKSNKEVNKDAEKAIEMNNINESASKRN